MESCGLGVLELWVSGVVLMVEVGVRGVWAVWWVVGGATRRDAVARLVMWEGGLIRA